MPQGTTISLEVTDSRRLTGENLWISGPGAIIEVAGDADDIRVAVTRWEAALSEILDQMGWKVHLAAHPFDGGANLAFEAPVDALYAATEINEAAFSAATADDRRVDPAEVERLIDLVADARRPALTNLAEAARCHNVSCLLDDDEVSIGSGRFSKKWPIDEIPEPSEIDWESVADVGVALVTGTNGKSTTVRLTASILQNAGVNTGFTSTDFIQVGSEIVDRGDYSGPGGAREVLRHPDVDAAVLEMARGGLLRRGLEMDRAAVACVTNVASDHLGEYGVNTVAELTKAKLLVVRGVLAGRPVVLNADISELNEQSSSIDNPILWFSRNAQNRTIVKHIENGGTAFVLEDDALVEKSSAGSRMVCVVEDIPITLGGAAVHNVENALAATAIATSMGLSSGEIAEGLRRFKGNAKDNPGRGNVFKIGGASIILDFAHNPHGLSAIIETLSRMPARRRLILVGQAGDRRDEDIRDLAAAAARLSPNHIITCEFPDYLRGRETGEVPSILRAELERLGTDPEQISYAPDCIAGTTQAIEWCDQGDVALLLAHSGRDQVLELLLAHEE